MLALFLYPFFEKVKELIKMINLTQDQLQQEIQYEAEAKETAKRLFLDRLERAKGENTLAQTQIGKGLLNYLTEKYHTNTLAFVQSELKPRRGVQKLYKEALKDYVEHLGLKEVVLTMCAVTLNTTINQCYSLQSNSVSNLARKIGQKVHEELKFEAFCRTHTDSVDKTVASLNKRVAEYKKGIFIRKVYKLHEYSFIEPSLKAKMTLGLSLLQILAQTTELFKMETQGKVMRIVPTDKFYQVWDKNTDFILSKLSGDVPTIIPPKPWADLENGAYYGELATNVRFIRQAFFRRKTRTYKTYIQNLSEIDLSEMMGAVNKIQETAYQINKKVLETVDYILEHGGDRAGLVATEPEPEIGLLEGEYTEEELKEHKRKYVKRIRREMVRKSKALRTFITWKKAKELAKYPTIYFPCNVDFRGRVYPISRFSHQGDDLMKGLIQYADPVPCKATSDISLLEIQGCNLYGNDKINLDDRIEWVRINKDLIVSCANVPLECNFWESADKPLQFLAFCIEYKNALDYIKNNGSILGYKCHIVIAYDGTCSGLQHYSALLHDEVGGKAVNLVDNEVPADIYQQVADKVIPKVTEDFEKGTEDSMRDQLRIYGTKTLATAWLSYGITRKVCKRSVMTLPYGSGQYGFSEHILADTCQDNPIFDGMEVQASRYLAKYIWQAVNQVVVSAITGMNYLKEIAKALTKEDLPVQWWTPLGFPVQQQYIKSKVESFRTRLGNKMSMPMYYIDVDKEEHVDKLAQKNGIAPNFIHSLDATHLMMVVNSAGLNNYSTIHDSFGTSLGEASHLKVVIREQLYKLYTEHRPLERFKEYAEMLIGHKLDIEDPKQGNLDLKEILKSTYVFH